ncbi:thiamine phosphate synthase [Paenibacillus sambharensis]
MGKMREFSLYVITGEQYHPGRSMLEVMEAALAGGADIVQLREKNLPASELLEKARALRELTRRYNVPFIVNDHPDIALAAEADGVHLGQEDMPIAEARERMGADRIIGISTHAIEEARAAERDGADYIGVGPVFPTGTKPGRQAVTTSYVRQVADEIRIPWVAIGGITPDNADQVLAAGASRLCAVSAVVGSSDPASVCRRLKEQIAAARGELVPIKLNGREEQVRAGTLEQLIQSYGLADKRIVAELDGAIVQRNRWESTQVRAGMTLELVHFVGGG